VVALSTLEAEYIGCSDATREAIWLRRLTTEIIGKQPPLRIYGDNQGALKPVKSGIIQASTKHIDVKFHHVHDEIRNNKPVDFEYIHTSKKHCRLPYQASTSGNTPPNAQAGRHVASKIR
jgi:hypothetical protein